MGSRNINNSAAYWMTIVQSLIQFFGIQAMNAKTNRTILAIGLGMLAMAAVTPAMADRDGGKGGGGGAPLPALGVTLLGQVIGVGGLYAAWRRRRSRKDQTSCTLGHRDQNA